jgi:hypothetical protein
MLAMLRLVLVGAAAGFRARAEGRGPSAAGRCIALRGGSGIAQRLQQHAVEAQLGGSRNAAMPMVIFS